MSGLMSDFQAEKADIARKCKQKKENLLSANGHLVNVVFLRKISHRKKDEYNERLSKCPEMSKKVQQKKGVI